MEAKNIIFLCTGNICRSPIGEALLKHAIEGLPETSPLRGLSILSAGTSTLNGMSASAHSVDVLNKSGIDLSKHKSQSLTEGMLKNCMLLLAMEESHLRQVNGGFKNKAEKACTVLDMIPNSKRRNISDPFGGSYSEYLEVRDDIASAIPHIIKYLKNQFSK